MNDNPLETRWELKTLTIATKKDLKILGINITRNVQNLSGESIKVLPRDKKAFECFWIGKTHIIKLSFLPQIILEFSRILHKNEAFVVFRQTDPQIHLEK